MPTTKTRGKCDVSKLKNGDKWSRISYGEIVAKNHDGIVVKNEQGFEWIVTEAIVEEEFFAAEQFTEVKELNRTQMVDTILSSARLVMTVNFKKKPDPKDLVSVVNDLLDDAEAGGKRPGKVILSRQLKAATGGKERTMVGRHQGKQDEFGRLQFVDMQASGSPLKQIDPRTICWAIVGNVKYVLK